MGSSELETKPVGRAALLSRFGAKERGVGFWVALWILVAAAEFVALIPVLFTDDPVVASDVVSRLLGGSFAACGLIAWRRRPDSLSGPLMAATGAGFFLYPLLSQIADDGVGGANETSGSGLRGLADRVEALSGHLYVTSPPGEGTVVTAELPV